jgi:hypothetical protein
VNSLHFLPNWYLEKITAKKIRALKILVIIFFTVDLILIDILVLNRNRVNIIKNEIKEKSISITKDYDEKNKLYKKNTKTLDTFLIFEENICNNIDLQSIYIESKNIDIKFDVHSVDSTMLIKKIESTNKFNIKYVYVPYDDSNNLAKIGLQLK